jgi:predicted SAM-dependent methyltransferase
MPSEKIINLGCGNSTYGDVRVDFIKTPTTTEVYDIEKGIPYPDNTFDKVYSRNILEHMSNVGFHLSECFRVLKPYGTVDITTDNALCYRYYLFGTHTGRYEQQHLGDHHYSIFTKKHLQNHFERAGFTKIQIEYVKTNTVGKWLDYITFQHPRIRVRATKC